MALDIKKIESGDPHAMLGIIEKVIIETDIICDKTTIAYGSLQDGGALVTQRESPVIVLQQGTQVPRDAWQNAYSLSFNVLVFYSTGQTLDGRLENALHKELSDVTTRIRIDVTRARYLCDNEGNLLIDEKVLNLIDRDIVWTDTTYSENFFGIDETERYPFAFSTSSFVLNTKDLPVG